MERMLNILMWNLFHKLLKNNSPQITVSILDHTKKVATITIENCDDYNDIERIFDKYSLDVVSKRKIHNGIVYNIAFESEEQINKLILRLKTIGNVKFIKDGLKMTNKIKKKISLKY